LNNVVEPESGVTILFNIADNCEQCAQQSIVQSCFHQYFIIYIHPLEEAGKNIFQEIFVLFRRGFSCIGVINNICTAVKRNP
jgi:hypothetical protein